MKNRNLSTVVMIIAALQLTACSKESSSLDLKSKPATIEKIEGTELSRVLLTQKAAERLGIETALVREMSAQSMEVPSSDKDAKPPQPSGVPQKVVPYSAVLYSTNGNTWVYKRPEPLTFVRHQIKVDYVRGDVAFISDGPPVGTEVVTVGVALLYGAELGFGS